MSLSAGDKAPSVTFKTMGDSGPENLTSADLFSGKKVVLFAVPGAFTPTCSAKHLPGFVQNAAAMKAKGVDEIACVSVNDAFVMGAWGKDQNAGDAVKMVADGNGEFAAACGLTMDGSGFGLGTRMQRCAMIVDDGKVSQLFVEEAGQFEKSTAENVLANL
ncbi:MAG: redoxin family protein [Alphaproteobacteria bacterium]|jgi:peroxiredoxin